MAKRSIQFIPPQKSSQLTHLADRARLSLAQYSGIEVDYNAIGLQTLDEWIERHVQQFPKDRCASLHSHSSFLPARGIEC